MVNSIEIHHLPKNLHFYDFNMKDFVVSVRKLTDVELMCEACEMTFLGTSKQSLLSIYKAEHSPVRTQLFWVTAKQIPLFIATHLLRHHVGSVPFQLTCRNDRQGGNPGLIDKLNTVISQLQGEITESTLETAIGELEWLQENSDRYTPVNLGLLVNAQSLIDMSKLRLCTGQAHRETVAVFEKIKQAISEVDPDLACMMVRKCVYRGGICGEPRCCGFNHSPKFQQEMTEYLRYFSDKQIGCYIKD